jgi:hypothetical protein
MFETRAAGNPKAISVVDCEGGGMQGRERTKEQLYREAKRLGVKGRSKMNKGQLKAAIDRRQ